MFFDELTVQDIGEGGEAGWNHHPLPPKKSKVAKRIRKQKDWEGVEEEEEEEKTAAA